MKYSIGICAYNEEENIAQLLTAIRHQPKSGKHTLVEILVVSSGSTDQTNTLVLKEAKNNPLVKLCIQRQREGKSSAVNVLLKRMKTDLLVLQSADTLPEPSAYDLLVRCFMNKEVGMVAPKIIPVDNPKSFMGYTTHLWWRLFDKINLQFPERVRTGEVVGLRKVFAKIPASSAVDEASIEPLIHLQGYKVAYCPQSVFRNKGPSTVRDFLRQRRRVYAGHTALKYRHGYTVVSYSNLRVLGVMLANFDWTNWRSFVYLPVAFFLEGLARLVGLIDYCLRVRQHTVWKVARSTKKLA